MKEDVWIPTVCGLCYSHDGILVHRVDGIVTKIEGNPDCPISKGKICSRGLSGVMLLYDPNRLNFPVKRTNPRKGIGVDPGWVRITWDEALDTVAAKLKELRQEDPRGLLSSYSVVALDQGRMAQMFGSAFGSPNTFLSGAGPHCGNAEHLFGGLLHAAWSKQPDYDYCSYLLNFGVPSGAGAYYCVSGMAQKLSDARARGMKHVVIDPMLNMAAEKSDEWIPIRPGTDGAFALALLNILLNELNIYDSDYLKRHTNAPYLIGENGYYIRDKQSGKPLIWDPTDSKAKTYDDPSIRDFALTGEFPAECHSERSEESPSSNCHAERSEGSGGAQILGKPAFSLLKDHVKKYTPDYASQITGISPETIRRIAREFGAAARVGSTITIDGKELPYRPVGVLYFKGAQGHKNATLNAMAIELLLEIVGASNVPGGILGMNSRSLGYPGSGRPSYTPSAGPDGLLKTGSWLTITRPYPHAEARKPQRYGLEDLIPTAIVCSPLAPLVMADPDKFKMPYKIKMHMHVGSNYLMTLADPEKVAKAFKDVFTVSFSLYLNESAEFADIVLPDACYLERYSYWVDSMLTNLPVEEWGYRLRQPVVQPLFERRDSQEVLLELAHRLGIQKELYTIMNISLGLSKPYMLNPISSPLTGELLPLIPSPLTGEGEGEGDKRLFQHSPQSRYTVEQIADNYYKSMFGEEHSLDWFKKHGVLKWPKKVEEVYWKPFVQARVPIYFESIKGIGEQVKKVTQENGIEGIDTSSFQPVPDWRPCPSHEEKRDGYDLYAIYFRVPLHTFSSTYNNPWLDEASRLDPYVYNIAISSGAARKRGIETGDWIELESAATGGKVKGRARVTEAIHPEVVAMANCGGHWARGTPLASQPGKGACIEWLLPLDLKNIDIPTLNQDLCVKVKVTRLE